MMAAPSLASEMLPVTLPPVNVIPERRSNSFAADVIRMHVGVDDVADRLGGRLDVPVRDARSRLRSPSRAACRARSSLILQATNRCQHLIAHRRQTAVHHQHTVAADRHGDVRASTLQHVNVAANRQDLNLTRWSLLRRNRNGRRGDGESGENGQQQPGAGQRGNDLCGHVGSGYFAGGSVFSFSLKSGYIVAAPPRVASIGRPCLIANSFV